MVGVVPPLDAIGAVPDTDVTGAVPDDADVIRPYVSTVILALV